MQHFVHVGVAQAEGDLLNQPAQLLAQVGAGHVVEELPQKGIGAGNQKPGFFEVERTFAQMGGQLLRCGAKQGGAFKHPRGKQPVNRRLGVHVAKLFGLKVGHEQRFEGGVLRLQCLVAGTY